MATTLPPKIEQLIQEHLQRGSYNSATEVIEEAFAALAERERFQVLRAEIDHADEQLARGEYTEYDADNLHELIEDVRISGMKRLAEERKRKPQ